MNKEITSSFDFISSSILTLASDVNPLQKTLYTLESNDSLFKYYCTIFINRFLNWTVIILLTSDISILYTEINII